jgi:hypothetical protein
VVQQDISETVGGAELVPQNSSSATACPNRMKSKTSVHNDTFLTRAKSTRLQCDDLRLRPAFSARKGILRSFWRKAKNDTTVAPRLQVFVKYGIVYE